MAKKCIDTKCKLWLEQANRDIKVFKKSLADNIKKLEKETPRDDAKIKRLKEFLKKSDPTQRKRDLEHCARMYCNEGCKNTLFEDGSSNVLSDGMKKDTNKKIT